MHSAGSPRGLITSTITMMFDRKGQVKDSTTVEQFTPLASTQRVRSPRGPPIAQTHRATQSLAQELKALAQLFFYKQQKPETRCKPNQRQLKEESLSWTRLMTGCKQLKRELAGQWNEAANSITERRGELIQAQNYCEEVRSRGPWKTNLAYKQMRASLQKKLKEKPDPNGDLDREIILRVVSPMSRQEGAPRYVGIEDMTPERLQCISKAAKRGFGGRPLPLDQLISNLNSLKSPSACEKRVDSVSSDTQDIGYKFSDRLETDPGGFHSRFESMGGSPVNYFISKEQSRYVRSPVSRVTIAKKKAVEKAMNRIRSSPEIVMRVQQLEHEEHKKRIRFLRSHTGITHPTTGVRMGHKGASVQLFTKL